MVGSGPQPGIAQSGSKAMRRACGHSMGQAPSAPGLYMKHRRNLQGFTGSPGTGRGQRGNHHPTSWARNAQGSRQATRWRPGGAGVGSGLRPRAPSCGSHGEAVRRVPWGHAQGVGRHTTDGRWDLIAEPRAEPLGAVNTARARSAASPASRAATPPCCRPPARPESSAGVQACGPATDSAIQAANAGSTHCTGRLSRAGSS